MKECLLYTQPEINAMLNQIAYKLNENYKDKTPIVVTVMNGGLIFAGNLIPKLSFDCELDYIHVSRYGDMQVGQEVRWLVEASLNCKGRDVIILDDILDEGITLEHIIRYFIIRGAKSINTAVLLWKVDKSRLLPSYFGAKIKDHFVYGYGMDLAGLKRNLPEIRYKCETN